MRIKSIVSESQQIQRAIALIKLGARLQVLESETDLSSACCASIRKSRASRRRAACCRSRPTGS
jgi:hypothetical protein